MSGAGNDFIVFDKIVNPDLILDSNAIKRLCDRRNGIGADGIITIGDSDSYDFMMEYYNSDGSTGSLCGNGARCAIKFAESTKRVKQQKAKFISNGKSYIGEVLNDSQVKVYFNEPQNLKYNFKVKAFGQLINASFVDTGSPHVVINTAEILKDPAKRQLFYENINDVPVYEIGKEVRNLPEFLPDGTNVNFYFIKDNQVYIRTYERGVEDETLACGTGNAATAIVINNLHKTAPPITLNTRGGDQLIIDFEKGNDIIRNLTLTGPVKVVFTGEINSNYILN
jgi:diaminopimelate epimerase